MLENDYREMYVSEGLEQIEIINNALLKLETEPDESEHIDSIFRSIHSLKGMAATMDYEQTRELCKNIEDTFDDLRKGRSKLSLDLTTALFKCIDALQQMILDENKKIDTQPYIKMLESPAETKITDAEPAITPNLPSIRVKISDIDSLANLVGEISIFKTKIENLIEKVDSDESQNLMKELENFVIDLRHQITKIRLVSIDHIFARFTRLVRDTSVSLGKQVTLHMDPSGIEIDRTVLEAITYPLLHILRNCVDHGLEKPGEREASGKSPTGNIYLMAYNMGDKIGIKIQDDGRGINLPKIKEKAIEKGIITSEKAKRMSTEEIIGLIGTPGLSTSQKVTDISGRGVGMDVVIKQIQKVGGNMKIDTELGKGTTITLTVPLALTLEPGVIVLGDKKKSITKLNSKEIQQLTSTFDEYIASKTSAALSTLFSEPITHKITVLEKGISSISEIKIPKDEIIMCGVRLNGKGDTHIEICYTIKLKHAKKIAAKLLGQNDISEIDELGTSAIQEVANIMTGSFFNAIADGTGFRVELSTPDFNKGELEPLVNTSAQDLNHPVDSAVIADVQFTGEHSEIKIHMIILQDPDNAKKLLDFNNNSRSKETIENISENLFSCDSNLEIDAIVDAALKERDN